MAAERPAVVGGFVLGAAALAVAAILFFGGWLPPIFWPLNLIPGVASFLNAIPGVLWLVAKIWFFFFLFAMVKAIVPRYRYDQLMRLGWKVFLPTSLVWVVLTAAWVLVFHHTA